MTAYVCPPVARCKPSKKSMTNHPCRNAPIVQSLLDICDGIRRRGLSHVRLLNRDEECVVHLLLNRLASLMA